MASAAFLMTACADYDNGFTAETVAYDAAFRKDFGNFDPTNDFNLAQRGSVTVTPNGNREVCVYKKAPNGYQLIARYDDVTTTRTLGFDIPKGETEILVTNGSETQVTTVGGSVTFGGGTRAGSYDSTDGNVSVALNEGIRYTYLKYNRTEAIKYRDVLPEGVNNRNSVKVQQDFSLVSTGEFIVYPTYWDCLAESEIGIYYYKDNEEIVSMPLFYNHKLNESVQYKDKDGNWVTYTERPIWSNGWTSCWPFLRMWDNNGEINDAARGQEITEFRSKGLIVNLPIGTKFGFYYTPYYFYNHASTKFAYHRGNESGDYITSAIPGWTGDKWTNSNGVWTSGKESRIFSSTELNTYYYVPLAEYESKNFKIAPFATYFDNKGDLNVCLEDMDHFTGQSTNKTSKPDFDYNDVQFKIYGSQPLILDNKAQSWHLAFEDLGGSFDWDFNDVVLQIDYVSGQSKARITPIAAGGTLHSEVFFDDTNDGSNKQDLGEIHRLLRAEEVADDVLYEPINAYSRGVPGIQKEVLITNPSQFSIANAETAANGSEAGTSSKSILGVYIETSGNKEGKTSTIAYQGTGKAPMMLVLPTSYQSESDKKYYEWAWPTECTDIRDAYNTEGHKFSDWVVNHTQAQDWYMHPTTSTVEAKVAGKYANGATTAGSEYNKPGYGTIIAFPTKANNQYEFSADIFGTATTATVTFALKGTKENKLCVKNSDTQLGTWFRLNNGGTFTTLGVNTLSPGNINVEGMYQVTLSSDDLDAIRTTGGWVIKAGEGSEIIYIAYKLGN